METGSVSDLSRLAGVSFAGAHREMRAMQRAGLATSRRAGGMKIYQADGSFPHAALLRALLSARRRNRPPRPGKEDRVTRAWLSELGAPLASRVPSSRMKHPGVEKVIAAGAALAHLDASVARALPVCIWRNRHRIDPGKLKVEARHAGETQAVGFFLDLTAELSGDREMRTWARRMRDRRIRRTSDFFRSTGSNYGRRLAEANSPPIARRWHFIMNMGMDSLESMFRRHVEEA
jgi:hypothetical protein